VKWGASDNVKVATVVAAVAGLATYQVLGSKRTTKEGHGYMSSEKPQALRNETERILEVEKAKLLKSPPQPAT